MMKKKLSKKRIVLFSVILLVILLLIPLLFNDRTYIPLKGPDLAEIKYTEIFFQSGDLQLSGMLILPEGKGPFPVAVIIHGSGTSRRNSVWYLSIAKHLQENNIAVLLPDKRGSEKSGGNWVGSNFDDLAEDTIGAIEYIKNQDQFSYTRIGVIGMSQGGWIAPIVATKTNISFIVSMVGPTVTTDEQLFYEVTTDIADYTYTFIAKLIAPIYVNKIKKKAFFKPLVGFDPIPYWKKVKIPVFLAFGENDKNVPVELSIKRLKENNLDDFKVKVYPDGGHAIMDKKTQKVQDTFLSDLVEFIKNKY